MRKFFVVVLIFSLFSCEREVSIEPISVDQELVVNAVVEPNSIDSLLLTSTFDKEKYIKTEYGDILTVYEKTEVEGADITVLNENDTIGCYHEKENGIYYYQGKNFKEQESYTLNIKHPNYAGVFAETTMPVVPEFGFASYENGEKVMRTDSYYKLLQILIEFKDTGDSNNFYMISAMRTKKWDYQIYDENDELKDTTRFSNSECYLNSKSSLVEINYNGSFYKFAQNNIDWESYYRVNAREIIFSDKFFNDEKVVIPIDLSVLDFENTTQVHVTLTAISEEYYQLIRSLAAYRKNETGFFQRHFKYILI